MKDIGLGARPKCSLNFAMFFGVNPLVVTRGRPPMTRNPRTSTSSGERGDGGESEAEEVPFIVLYCWSYVSL